jgi:uncharacterized protein YaiE (UPF0345 family)
MLPSAWKAPTKRHDGQWSGYLYSNETAGGIATRRGRPGLRLLGGLTDLSFLYFVPQNPPILHKYSMPEIPVTFPNVTVTAKANVYFDGKVVSHTILLPDGEKKTLGLIYPGTYHFGTALAERMEITAGSCHVTLDGAADSRACQSGSSFHVPAQSGFTIVVEAGICEYICSFIP